MKLAIVPVEATEEILSAIEEEMEDQQAAGETDADGLYQAVLFAARSQTQYPLKTVTPEMMTAARNTIQNWTRWKKGGQTISGKDAEDLAASIFRAIGLEVE